MASTIKGIKVEIGGDTTDLQAALKDVNSISKNLTSELNLVNKQLKFDPSNAVLLAQKQDILEEKISNTKIALEKLQSVQDQIEDQANSGELGADKYRAYQREVEATKGILENLQKQLEDTKTAQSGFESDVKNTNLSSGTQEIKELKDEIKELNSQADKTNLSNLKREIDDVKTSASELKDNLKDTAKGIGTGLAAAGGAVGAAIASYDSVEGAMKAMQAATGLSDSAMQNYRSTLEDIYNSNFGESLEDVASKMANVVQFTNETDPNKIGDFVKKLYGLEDTFGMDFNESLRGVQGLITNMGVSAENAFDLIASGAQNGLNYSDELGDNIAEYSQLWGQAGFSASEMFAILDNGAESGAYNLDKVNDFVKEFTISLSDGRIEKNIVLFSDKTGELFRKWKNGEATASEVFYSVINDLDTATNKQDMLTLASDTWSALGEDNALNVISSLNKVNTKFDNVKGTMDKVNSVKYDDVGNRLASLGRKAQTEVINPLVEDFFPEIEDGIDWVSDNLDDLIPLIKGIGRQIALVWGVKKASEFVKGVVNLVNAYKSLKTATDAAKASQQALSLAQNTNVIGLIATAIGTLINIVWTFSDAQDEAKVETEELTEAQRLQDEKLDELKDSYNNFVSSRDEAVSNTSSEFQYYNNLWTELDKIVGKNGEVKKGYEDRAKFITQELEKITGKEIEWNGNVITSYDELAESIQNVLKIKEGEAILSSAEGSYIEAIQNKDKTISDAATAYNKLPALKKTRNNAYDRWFKLYQIQIRDDINEIIQWATESGESVGTVDELNEYKNKLNQAVESAAGDLNDANTNLAKAQEEYITLNDTAKEYQRTIDYYEDLSEAVVSKDTDKINAALKKMTTNFITAENGTENSLRNQLNSYKTKYKEMEKAVKNGAEGITQSQVDELKKMVDSAQTEYDRYVQNYQGIESKTQKNIDENVKKNTVKTKAMASGVNEAARGIEVSKIFKGDFDKAGEAIDLKSPELETKSQNAATRTRNAAKIGGWFDIGSGFIGSLISGIFSKNTDSENAGKTSAESAKSGTGKVNLFSKGASLIGGFISGIFSKNTDSENAGKTSAENAKSGTEKVNLFSKGASLIGSFISGIFSKNTDVENAGKTSANKAKKGSEKVSLFSLGNNLVGGFINGILSGEAFQRIGAAAESVAKKAYGAIKSWLGIASPSKETQKLGKFFSQGFALGIKENSNLANSAAQELAENAQSSLANIDISNTLSKIQSLRDKSAIKPINSQSIRNITNAPIVNLNISNVTINNDNDINSLADKLSVALGDRIISKGMGWG